MIIESSPISNNNKKIFKKIASFTAYSLLISFVVITTIAIIGANSQPTGSYLSPLPAGELAQTTPTPTPASQTPQKSVSELINLAQNYLDKAFQIAKTTNQTQQQKDQIIQNLDQSLSLTTQAIQQEPANPKGYILRAQILTAISQQNPQALSQAQKDLEIAQSLSQGQPITLPKATNPLNLLPNKQAIAKSDLVLAAPEDNSQSTSSAKVASNSTTTELTLPAGQTQLLVKNPAINSDSYIYLIPQSKTNTPLFVKAKGQGQFTLAAANPPETDLVLNYYIINP